MHLDECRSEWQRVIWRGIRGIPDSSLSILFSTQLDLTYTYSVDTAAVSVVPLSTLYDLPTFCPSIRSRAKDVWLCELSSPLPTCPRLGHSGQ